jgi:hypothetical protein
MKCFTQPIECFYSVCFYSLFRISASFASFSGKPWVPYHKVHLFYPPIPLTAKKILMRKWFPKKTEPHETARLDDVSLLYLPD